MFIDLPQVNLPRLVIVGGGFAGIELAKQVRNRFQVVMIDKNNFHTFQPLLYQVATAGMEPDSIVFPLRKLFKGVKHFHFRLAEAQEIIPTKNIIKTSIGEIEYDYLVIATGSTTSYFGMERLMANSMPMKSISEALDLRSCILQNFEKAINTPDLKEREALMNLVIVGGGPTGVELAGALGELKKHVLPNDYPELDFRRMQIHLIDSGERVLGSFEEKASLAAKKFLEELDVHVWLNMRVTDYDGLEVTTDSTEEFRAATLIWAAGVVGVRIQGIPDSAKTRGGRIRVDAFNQVVDTTNIFSLGDVAAMETDATPQAHPQVAQVAIQMATNLGKNLKRSATTREGWKPFQYKDKGSMATVGRNRAVVEASFMKTQGIFAWFVWMFIHLIALVGFRNRVVVFFNWLVNYINYDRGLRVIIRPFLPRKNS